jgi:hypothetical protein
MYLTYIVVPTKCLVTHFFTYIKFSQEPSKELLEVSKTF